MGAVVRLMCVLLVGSIVGHSVHKVGGVLAQDTSASLRDTVTDGSGAVDLSSSNFSQSQAAQPGREVQFALKLPF